MVTIKNANNLVLYISTADTTKTTLEEAVLAGANLRGANLRSSDLRGADLAGADLRGANLTGADLTDANITDADLRSSDLRSSDLRGANLTGADLRGADLAGADLRGANLTGALGVIDAGQCSRGYQWIAVQNAKGYRIAAGCRWFTRGEALDHWSTDSYIGGGDLTEIANKLNYLHAEATRRGWA